MYNVIEVATIFRVVGSYPFSTNSIKPLVPTLLFALGFARFTNDTDLALPMLLGVGVAVAIVHLLSMILTRSLGHAGFLLFEQFEERSGLDLDWVESLIRRYY